MRQWGGMTGESDRPVFPLTGWRAAGKRILDLFVACLLLPLLVPLWITLAVIIRMDSFGPVLYRQVRVGKKGQLFTLYKLRSMIYGAEDLTGPVWAQDPDQRETRVGRYLRRYGLDETLQVVNVLRGDMSLVGPRPERPFFVEQFKKTVPGYAGRLLVKPGITGWAQTHMKHRYDVSVHDVRTKLTYDLEYIRFQSVWFDMLILLKTVTMFTGRGRKSESPPPLSSAAEPSRASVQIN